jgi:MscS family membrane protein
MKRKWSTIFYGVRMSFKPILCFILLCSLTKSFATGVAYPTEKLETPRSSMNYFLKTMKAYKLGDTNAINMAIKTIDLSAYPSDVKIPSAQNTAIQLINTLDRIQYINIKEIPNNNDQSIWVFKKESVIVDNKNYDVEISLSRNKDKKWRFTINTINTIPYYIKSLEQKSVVKGVIEHTSIAYKIKKSMPVWTGKKTFIILNGQWIGILFIIFFSFVIERVLSLFIVRFIKNFLARNGVRPSKKLTQSFTIPVTLLTFSSLWIMGINLLEFQPSGLSLLLRIGKVLFTLGVIYLTYNITDFLCLYLEKKSLLSENKFDDILVPLIRKSAKTFIIAVGVIAIGDSLTLDMKGLLAGMGIVGLGVSLAAKDTISNLFGSLTVLLDRPFLIGDWVVIDGTVEGTVEEVGLRSCRIRTFYNSVITIPNGTLTNAHIDNYGMRSHRRFTTNLSVQYDTSPEKINEFCDGIKEIILKQPHTQKENYHVYFNNMQSSSLDILLYVFFTVPTWSDELNERHKLLNEILDFGNNIGVSFAFPTQTLHLQGIQEMSQISNDTKLI